MLVMEHCQIPTVQEGVLKCTYFFSSIVQELAGAGVGVGVLEGYVEFVVNPLHL